MSRPSILARFATTLLAPVALSALLAACAQPSATLQGTPSLQTAQVALAGGSPSVALRICDGLVARESRNADYLACRGDALTAMDRYAEAAPAYQAALQTNPTLVSAQVGLGRLALRSDAARAETLFLEALANEPRNAAALNDLGIARDLQGRHADAQTAYGEAIAAAPEMRAAQVNLALSLAMTGKSEQAIRIMRPIATRPDATQRERHDLAAVLAINGKQDEAEQLLRADLNGAQANEAVAGFRSLQSR